MTGKMENSTEAGNGNSSPVDVFSGSKVVKEVQQERYLGDILSCDGKNQKNITARKNKGTGIITQIMSILEDICFGNYYFQVAIILRNSLLISSLLSNAEGWYKLTKSEIEELESVDERLLRKVLESPVSTPKEMLYLELGVLPIGFIIRMRRLHFLKYILDEDENSLIHTFLKA